MGLVRRHIQGVAVGNSLNATMVEGLGRGPVLGRILRGGLVLRL